MRPLAHSSASILLLFALVAAFSTPLRSQIVPPVPDELEPVIERAIEGSTQEETDAPELIDELERYRRRPIGLYTATADSLARLPGISIQDAFAILDFVDSTAPASMEQLEAIATLDAEQLQVLRAYTSLRHPRFPAAPRRLIVSMRTRFQQDLQPRKGYTDKVRRLLLRRDPVTGDPLEPDTATLGSSYLGGRQGLMMRILVTHGDFSAGITFQKDPGEPIVHTDTASFAYTRDELVDPAAPVSGIDRRFGSFASAHAEARLGDFTLHAGDYVAEFGQGLLLWTSFGGAKGSDVIRSPYKSPRGITGYRSAGEASFLRGGAIGFERQSPGRTGFGAHLFWSSRALDASIEEGTDAEGEPVQQIGSVREDGYRRTRSELRRSGNLNETLFGGNMWVRFRGGELGLTAYTSAYGMQPSADLARTRGTGRTTMIGIDGRYARWGVMLFGELARAANGALGAVGGVATTIHGIDLTVAGRWLPATFTTPHGAGFGESPLRQHNEQGIYIAAKAPILPKLTLSSYFDLYRIPERTDLVPFPRNGADGYLQFDYTPTPALKLEARLRSDSKQAALTVADALGRDRRRLIDRTSASGRLSMEYLTHGGAFRLRARIERRFIGSSDGVPASDGVLSYVDFRLCPMPAISLGARAVLFDIDDFDAAMYEFEQELPGRLTNLALSGEGRRFYLYVFWNPSPTYSIAVKYAETVYIDRESISPGTLQEIAGPVSNNIAVQLDLKF